MTAVAHPEARRETRAPAATSPETIRVLVVDDHLAVRTGLRKLLDEQPDLGVVDVVASAEVAAAVAERARVDVAVVDYHLGGRNGLWLSRKLKRLPGPPKVVIYSAYSDGVLTAASIAAEADGLLSKGSIGRDLCDAIRAVASGEMVLPVPPQRVAEMMRARLDQDEQAIFGLLLAGTARQDIARTLGFSRARVEGRLATMLQKLEAFPGLA